MKKVLKTIGWVMVAVAALFVAFALGHPEASFPWSNGITYTIYGLYIIVTLGLLILPRK